MNKEFRVNNYTYNAQTAPSVTALNDGGFVVVWVSTGQDEDTKSVRGQKFLADGTEVYEEFRADQFLGGDAFNPKVSQSEIGFTVAWQDNYAISQNSGVNNFINNIDASIHLQGFNLNTSITHINVSDTSEVFYSTFIDADSTFKECANVEQYNPSLSFQGTTVLGWTMYCQAFAPVPRHSVPYYKVYVGKYISNMLGEMLSFQADDSHGYKASSGIWWQNSDVLPLKNAVVAVISSKNISLVVWGVSLPDAEMQDIYARAIDYVTGAKSNLFKVNTHIEGPQIQPAIAVLNDGSFVVTWQSYDQDDSVEGIYAQKFSIGSSITSVIREGVEFPVNNYTLNAQKNPSIAALQNGGFVIAWDSRGQSDPQDPGVVEDIYAQIFFANTTKNGMEFLVNNHTYDAQKNPTIASLHNGDFVVAWQSYGQDSSAEGIFARVFEINYSPTVITHPTYSDTPIKTLSIINRAISNTRSDSFTSARSVTDFKTVTQTATKTDTRFFPGFIKHTDSAKLTEKTTPTTTEDITPTTSRTFSETRTHTTGSATPTGPMTITRTATEDITPTTSRTFSETSTHTTGSVTPTEHMTLTRTATEDISPTTSRTFSETSTHTTGSVTPTGHMTITRTATEGITPTTSRTFSETSTHTTGSVTPTGHMTITRTATEDISPTTSRTFSETSTHTTGSVTPTGHMTLTRTATEDITPTTSRTFSETSTHTTGSVTLTSLKTFTRTATEDITHTTSRTFSETSTHTTGSVTPTGHMTLTRTATEGITPTTSRTFSETSTHTTGSVTPTSHMTLTRTATEDITPTTSRTFSETSTHTTGSVTPTNHMTLTRTATEDISPTTSRTFSETSTHTTGSVTPTGHMTITRTATEDISPTTSRTFSETSTHTTGSVTLTSLKTFTRTATEDITHTTSRTFSETSTHTTGSATPTGSMTLTRTATEDITRTASETVTELSTFTATDSVQSLGSITPTGIKSSTDTNSMTATGSLTISGSFTDKRSITISDTSHLTDTGSATVSSTATESITFTEIGCNYSALPGADMTIQFAQKYYTNVNDFFPIMPSVSSVLPSSFFNKSISDSEEFDNGYRILVWIDSDNTNVKVQFFDNEGVASGSEKQIGVFDQVNLARTSIYNVNSIVLGWSIFVQGQYNILLQYIHSDNTTIQNILVLPSYDGAFAIATLDQSQTFVVISRPSQYGLIVQKFTFDGIDVLFCSDLYGTFESVDILFDIKSASNGSFNIFWSFLDDQGIFIESHDREMSYVAGSRLNIEENIVEFQVDSLASGDSIIKWQQNQICNNCIDVNFALFINSGNVPYGGINILPSGENLLIAGVNLIQVNKAALWMKVASLSNFAHIVYLEYENGGAICNEAIYHLTTFGMINNQTAASEWKSFFSQIKNVNYLTDKEQTTIMQLTGKSLTEIVMAGNPDNNCATDSRLRIAATAADPIGLQLLRLFDSIFRPGARAYGRLPNGAWQSASSVQTSTEMMCVGSTPPSSPTVPGGAFPTGESLGGLIAGPAAELALVGAPIATTPILGFLTSPLGIFTLTLGGAALGLIVTGIVLCVKECGGSDTDNKQPPLPPIQLLLTPVYVTPTPLRATLTLELTNSNTDSKSVTVTPSIASSYTHTMTDTVSNSDTPISSRTPGNTNSATATTVLSETYTDSTTHSATSISVTNELTFTNTLSVTSTSTSLSVTPPIEFTSLDTDYKSLTPYIASSDTHTETFTDIAIEALCMDGCDLKSNETYALMSYLGGDLNNIDSQFFNQGFDCGC